MGPEIFEGRMTEQCEMCGRFLRKKNPERFFTGKVIRRMKDSATVPVLCSKECGERAGALIEKVT